MSDRTEVVAFAMWKEEADRAAPNVGKNRTPEAFANASDQERQKWLGLASAAIAALDLCDAQIAVVKTYRSKAMQCASDIAVLVDPALAAVKRNT